MMDPLKLGALLKERRKAARLSRKTLAQRTGFSESTVKNLENGRHQPTQHTLSLLLSVPELNLRPDDLFSVAVAPPPLPVIAMNSYLAPGTDPMQAVADIQKRLQGEGGSLEQSSLYLDPAGAAAWYAVANVPAYAARRELQHLGDVAAAVLQQVGTAGLDVIGLGCGDGHKEVRLVQHLLADPEPPAIRLFLLDLSQPLLAHAFRTASQNLPRGASAFAIQGNFHHLPLYMGVMERLGARRRLLCLFGGTFGNLDNEVRFLRHNLQGLEPGDLLLLHVGRCYAPCDQPEAVRRLDPQLNGTTPHEVQALERQWLTGPLERYGRQVGDPLPELEVESRFDNTSCVVPGSYAIEKAVLVKEPGRLPRRFVVTYVKRYEPIGLAGCMNELGWKPLAIYDQEVGNHLLALFQQQD